MRTAIADMAPKQAANAEGKFRLSGGELHPNGRWLVYGINRDPASGQETEASLVIRLDLASGEERVLARPQRAGGPAPMLNAQGSHVLYARKDRHPAGRQYWLVDIEGGTDREILNFGEDVEISASWAPSGQQVVVLADSGSHRRLGLWVLASALIYWFIDDPLDQIEEAFIPFGAGVIAMVGAVDARRRAWFFDPAKRTRQQWPAGKGRTLLPIAPLAGGGWAARLYRAGQPDDVVRFRPGEGQALASLTGLPTLLGSLTAELAAPEDFRWRAADGLALQGWLYRPKAAARGTIVLLHPRPGHPAEDRFDPFAQYVLRRGFAVFQPNPRGSSGFGLSFRQAIVKRGWGGPEQNDVRSGIEALIAKGIAGNGPVGVTGIGFGGYSAWWAVTHWPTALVAAAAPVSAMADLALYHRTTKPDCRAGLEAAMGGPPESLAARYKERSPIHDVAGIEAPLLLVHGLEDPIVTPENLAAARHALDAAKRPYDILTFEDEGHGVRLRANRRLLWRRLADFFEATLVG
jgi:dipeptidyl aminopeptidase/acylaminoacyl peptidase